MAHSQRFCRKQSAGNFASVLCDSCSLVPLLLIVLLTGCASRQQTVRTEGPVEAVKAISRAESLDTISVRADRPDTQTLLVAYSEAVALEDVNERSSTKRSSPHQTMH
ncbi:MAG: putative lipoprotein YajG [Planctomycetaceae bacterium]|jgi:uncharacterized lipoprotein YajG